MFQIVWIAFKSIIPLLYELHKVVVSDNFNTICTGYYCILCIMYSF